MSLLNSARTNVNGITNKIKNPFEFRTQNDLRGEDFIEGFNFQETTGPKERVRLNGNLMPHVPFSFGGEQRIVKDYYSGQSEPAVHVLGPKEKDLVVSGRFKDKNYSDVDVYGTATEIQKFCDSLRIRGNVLRIWLGEWQRYGILKSSDFQLRTLGDIEYTLTFDIIGFNGPINGKFVEKLKAIPFSINKELIEEANLFNDLSRIPTTVPASISDLITSATSAVAEAISIVTDFVDTVISTVNDIRKSVQRVLGLIKHAQNKLREYKKTIGNFALTDASQAVTGRYENASFYAGRISYASLLTALLLRFRKQFSDLIDTEANEIYTVKEGDSLQKIAVRFYSDSSKWKTIYDHNNLTTTDLTDVDTLEIPS